MAGALWRSRMAVRDDRRGIAALEYALLLGIIGIAVFTAAVHFEATEARLYNDMGTAFSSAASTAFASASSALGGTGSTSTGGTSTGGTSTGGTSSGPVGQ
ncbi:MAG: hypothetical protein KGL52_17665 [Rhodospirillales bacterium]|nr:hypothetical protein [Rhodospirillales bacterium]